MPVCKERMIFFVAGTLILTGLTLGHWVSPWWLLLSAFVGVNMFQASLTGFCPLSKILNGIGVKACTANSPTM